jgi:O-acetyl-ADP-ribose deacetylase (regulator of RNase III)
LESTAQTLVNTVNCVGVMGKGIAKEFKQRDPAMFQAYKKICDDKLLEPGKLWLWQGARGWVLNFPTKIHWRNPSKIEWIEAGLRKFVATYSDRGIREISFPRLGCGNGGLEWDDVKPLIEQYLNDLSIPVYIHDFMLDIGVPEHLEDISRRRREEGADADTFESFLAAIRRITEIGGDLVELEGEKQFRASMDVEGNLDIETDVLGLRLEREDLRGVWLSLSNGLGLGRE